mmetsp:Transcript_16894/g.43824  ORF Transcript_16894/g.43824 Transcript_16894/m.43824 type:complete len:191 (+) Transcript_16894:249-821(+)|eukprot:jgi/Tetstr1/431952/TSEL_021429.t1
MMKLKTFGAPLVVLGYKYLNVDPSLQQARTAFGLSLGLVVLTCLFLYSKVNKHKQTDKTVTVKTKNMQGEATEQTLTWMEYDVSELQKVLRQTLVGAAIVVAIHSWKGYVQPLVFQALLLPLTMLDHQLFHIYILGRPATGDLERPWKEDNPFAAIQQQMEKSSEATGEIEGSGSKSGKGSAKKQSKKEK